MTTNWHDLIQRYISGTITAAETEALEQQLKTDAALRDWYLDALNLDSALEASAESAQTALSLPVPFSQRALTPAGATSTRWFAWRPLAAAAAALLIGFVVFGWSRRGVEVEVVQTSGGVSGDWVVGHMARLNHVALIRGSVQMRLSSGVLLDVSAPVEMTLVDDMHVRVLSGRITADVGDEGKGFVIETPQARVVDLGTRFGVDASDAALTSVLVFQGQVEVYEKGATQPVALLNTGEGMRIDNHRRASRIVSVSGTDAANGWTATTPSVASALISAVRDSMAANEEAAKTWPSLRNFYRIVPGGLRDGALAFSDAADEWSDVPASLVGADQVRTFAVDGFNWFMKLTIEVTRPVELFVLVDQRNPVPEWVSADFTDTGETITLNFKPSQAKGQVAKRLPYSVWKRAVHTAGEVTLGAPYPNPPVDKKSFSPNRMFGVAAKALP
jgi:ferric-dicitrate binding protein FerR (iron transport regulator)